MRIHQMCATTEDHNSQRDHQQEEARDFNTIIQSTYTNEESNGNYEQTATTRKATDIRCYQLLHSGELEDHSGRRLACPLVQNDLTHSPKAGIDGDSWGQYWRTWKTYQRPCGMHGQITEINVIMSKYGQ